MFVSVYNSVSELLTRVFVLEQALLASASCIRNIS